MWKLPDVVIIGNAPIGKDFTELVNAASFVVRFNEAGNYNRNCGTRTDALCVTNLCDPGRRFAKTRIVKTLPFISQTHEIWFPRTSDYYPLQYWFKPLGRDAFRRANYARHIVSRNQLQDKKVVSFSTELYQAACRDLHLPADRLDGQVPSSGYLAVHYALERFPAPEFKVVLLGFSFQGLGPHCWAREKERVEGLQKAGSLEWVN